MASAYDVYLNGTGYMLAKDDKGRLLSGASRGQLVDPFTRYMSERERWRVQSFRFEDGAGALQVDGTPRYASGVNIDTRGGRLLLGPEWEMCDDDETAYSQVDAGPNVDYDISNAAPDDDGVGVRFYNTSARDVRTVGLLVKRDLAHDYGPAGNMTVEINADAAGPRPGAAVGVGSVAVSIKLTPHWWVRWEDLWLAGEYFWLEVSFSATVALAATTYYWLTIRNSQAHPIHWGGDVINAGTISYWDGAAWTAGAAGTIPYYKLKGYTQIDGHVRAFANFRGNPAGTGDGFRRLYAAVGPKVMYYNWSTGAWANSKGDFVEQVLCLLEFNNRLFAGQGWTYDMWYTDGASATTTWTQVTGVQAQALAVHDNMLWRADGAQVQGSTTGSVGSWTGAMAYVGDVGIAICRLVSHGARLYALKPEGVFEISYASGYPASGAITVNQVLDFYTERVSRPWLLDWHSGLYFPGMHGVYEWRNGVLRDVWRERWNDAGTEMLNPIQDENTGRMLAATGTTRGMMLAQMSPYLNEAWRMQSQVWCFDGRRWHPLATERGFFGEYIEAIHVESWVGAMAHLWWGQGFDIAMARWPMWTDNRDDDSWSRFYTGTQSWAYLPEFIGERLDELKDFYAVRVYTNNAGAAAGGEVSIYYSIDGGSWLLLGTVDTSPVEELVLPANTTGYKIQLQAWLEPNGATDTVQVDQVDLVYQPLPDTVNQRQVVIKAARGLRTHTGTTDERSAKTIVAALEALEEELEPWVYVDIYGNSHCVRSVGVTTQDERQIEMASPEPGWEMESNVIVTMVKVADSCPS